MTMKDYAEKVSYESVYGSPKSGSLNAVKETPLTRLSGAVERLHKAEAMASNLAGKLVGEQMTGEGGETTAPVGPGMLGAFEELANVIIHAANNITSDLARIERRI